MRARAVLMAALLVSSLAGCNSAKITDAYMAIDSQGIRRTTCFRPEWSEIHAVVEFVSFKDDTFLTVFGTSLEHRDDPDVYMTLNHDELEQFGNIAPGKGDFLLAIPFGKEFRPPRAAPTPPEGTECEPQGAPEPWFPRGEYAVDIFLDKQFITPTDKPDRSLYFDVSEECPCRPFPECPRVCYEDTDCQSTERCLEFQCQPADAKYLECYPH